MKLLLSNDDGFDAPGLAALLRVCETLGSVVVVAPAGPRSGVGHAVTTHQPLSVRERAPGRFAVDGTPADCARVGLVEIAPDSDWLVAGINAGGNLGSDVYTSGTVAAAREAALLGRPALAVSQYVARGRRIDWEASAARARLVIEHVTARGCAAHHYWNANLPHPADERRDCALCETPLDPNPLDVRFRKEGGRLAWDGDYHRRPRESGSDVDVCFRGDIALTLLPLRIVA